MKLAVLLMCGALMVQWVLLIVLGIAGGFYWMVPPAAIGVAGDLVTVWWARRATWE